MALGKALSQKPCSLALVDFQTSGPGPSPKVVASRQPPPAVLAQMSAVPVRPLLQRMMAVYASPRAEESRSGGAARMASTAWPSTRPTSLPEPGICALASGAIMRSPMHSRFGALDSLHARRRPGAGGYSHVPAAGGLAVAFRRWLTEDQMERPMKAAPMRPVIASGTSTTVPTSMSRASAPMAQKAPCSRYR